MYLIRRLALLLIVWLATFSTVASAAAAPQEDTPSQPPRLQVSLFNDAGVDPATLAEAESRASAIFSHSGIAVDWLVCSAANPNDFSPAVTPCSTLSWPFHLSIRIRPSAISISADTFGQAFLSAAGEGVYSNVYFHNISRGGHSADLPEAELLGCVLAHELGHLLLGTNSHSPSGLMQPRWDSATLSAAARSGLFFTSAQTALLRSRLTPAQQPLVLRSFSPGGFLFSLSARL